MLFYVFLLYFLLFIPLYLLFNPPSLLIECSPSVSMFYPDKLPSTSSSSLLSITESSSLLFIRVSVMIMMINFNQSISLYIRNKCSIELLNYSSITILLVDVVVVVIDWLILLYSVDDTRGLVGLMSRLTSGSPLLSRLITPASSTFFNQARKKIKKKIQREKNAFSNLNKYLFKFVLEGKFPPSFHEYRERERKRETTTKK